MEALPDALLVSLLLLLPLDARMRCAALSRRFAALSAASPELWCELRFDDVSRTRRRRVDDALLARLVQRSAGALEALDLSLLPRGRFSASGVLHALRACARLRLLRAWRDDAWYDLQQERAWEFSDAAAAAHDAVPLVALARAHGACSRHVHAFCSALHRLTVCDGPGADPAAAAAVAAGGLDAVLAALAAHTEDALVQHDALLALYTLMDGVTPEEHAPPAPPALGRAVAAASLRAGQAAAAALVAHEEDLEVVARALDVQYALLRRDPVGGGGAVCARRVARAALALLARHASVECVRRSCLALLTLDCITDELLPPAPSAAADACHEDCSALELVLHVAEAHTDAVAQSDAVHALAALLARRQRAGRAAAPLAPASLAPRLLAAIVAALRCETEPDSYFYCWRRFAFTTVNALTSAFIAGTVSAPQLLAAGAVPALVATLRAHAADAAAAAPVLPCHAIILHFTLLLSPRRMVPDLRSGEIVMLPEPPLAAAAAQLAEEVDACTRAALRAGLLQALAVVQVTWQADMLIGGLMCRLVVALLPLMCADAAAHDAVVPMPAGDADAAMDAACRLVAAALRAHPSLGDGLGLSALLECAGHSDACRARLVAAGGAAAATAVLAAAREADTVAAACDVLLRLAEGGIADCAAALAAAGALPALAAALRQHASDADADTAVAACEAMGAMGGAVAAAAAAQDGGGALDDALAALREAAALAHPAAQALRDAAGAAQRSLTAASAVAAAPPPDDDGAAAQQQQQQQQDVVAARAPSDDGDAAAAAS
jgi:hypothetical protein